MTSKETDCCCPVCDSADALTADEQPEDFEYFIIPQRSLRVFNCGTCGARFLWPRPSHGELLSFYPPDYHAYNEDHGRVALWLVRMRAKMRARQLLKLAGREPVRLFDVGTGDCRHFEEMNRYGMFECAGIEINPAMVSAAGSRGYMVHQGTLETLDIEPIRGGFDIVTMYQLLEHVESPSDVLIRPSAFFGRAAQWSVSCLVWTVWSAQFSEGTGLVTITRDICRLSPLTA